jgi:hypothetical protein
MTGPHAILTASIDALPADYGTALVLHDVEEVSKPDIVEVLGIDMPGVNLRIHRYSYASVCPSTSNPPQWRERLRIPATNDAMNRSPSAQHPIR